MSEPVEDLTYSDYLAGVARQRERDKDRFTGASSHADDDAFDARNGAPMKVPDGTRVMHLHLTPAPASFWHLAVEPESEYGPHPMVDGLGRRIFFNQPIQKPDGWNWYELVDGTPLRFQNLKNHWWIARADGGGDQYVDGRWLRFIPGAVAWQVRRVARRLAAQSAPAPKALFS